MTGPRNYQSSSYTKQAAEFKRQHGDMATAAHATCTKIVNGVPVPFYMAQPGAIYSQENSPVQPLADHIELPVAVTRDKNGNRIRQGAK